MTDPFAIELASAPTTQRPSRRSLWAAVAWAGLLFVGCDGPSRPGPLPDDAGAGLDGGDGAVATVIAPAEPHPPAAADSMPCRDGWAVADLHGNPICRPAWLEEPCPAFEVRWPGETSCAPIGGRCDAGEFPSGLPDTGVRYVRQGAIDGRGTRDRPYGEIDEALFAIVPGTIIAIARGTYSGQVLLPRGVTLRGACTAETILTHPVPADREGVVEVLPSSGAPEGAEPTVLANVTITGPRPGLWILGPNEVEVEGVIVDRVRTAAVIVQGARAHIREIGIRGTQADPEYGVGRGIDVEGEGNVTVDRFLIENNIGAGILVSDAGSEANLVDGTVRATATIEDFAAEVAAVAGGKVTARGVVLEGGADFGALSIDAGSELSMADCTVRRMAGVAIGARLGGVLALERMAITESRVGIGGSDSARVDGNDLVVTDHLEGGVEALFGATVTVGRVLIAQNGVGALSAYTEDAISTVVLSDAVVIGNQRSGLMAQDGSFAEVNRAVLRDNHTAAVAVRGEGSRAVLRDVAVSATGLVGGMGRGLEVRLGASATVERMSVHDQADIGVFVEGGRLEGSDLRIADIVSQPDGRLGRGLEVNSGGVIALQRVSIERVAQIGVMIVDPGGPIGAPENADDHDSRLTDLLVRDMLGDPAGDIGRHVHVAGGASVSIERAQLEGGIEVGVTVFGDGSSLHMVETVVSDTSRRTCAMTTCEGSGFGIALGSYAGGLVDVDRFLLRDGALCGVQLGGGFADLHHGEIANHPVGVNIQTPGFDALRLADDVTYRNVDRRIDATALPVPAVVVPAGMD